MNPLVSAGLVSPELMEILAVPEGDAAVTNKHTKRITGARTLTADDYAEMLREDKRKKDEAEEEEKKRKEEREQKKKEREEKIRQQRARRGRGRGRGWGRGLGRGKGKQRELSSSASQRMYSDSDPEIPPPPPPADSPPPESYDSDDEQEAGPSSSLQSRMVVGDRCLHAFNRMTVTVTKMMAYSVPYVKRMNQRV